jgi:hypothetical protein
VLLFKRLLSFPFGSKLRDKRGDQRHPVGSGFPLKGSVSLIGRDTLPKPGAAARANACNWGGRPSNLSRHGVSLQLPPAAVTVRGEQTELELTLESHRLVIPCVVAHFRSYNSHSLCGLSLKLDNPKLETAYLQLLETVAIGASFTAVPPSVLKRNPTGLVREQYVADNKFLLSAWRDAPSRELAGFELLLGDYCAKGEMQGRDLEIYSRESQSNPAKTTLTAPAFGFTTGVHAEVRQLYRWVVLNLPKSVPFDLRALLERFIRKTDVLK